MPWLDFLALIPPAFVLRGNRTTVRQAACVDVATSHRLICPPLLLLKSTSAHIILCSFLFTALMARHTGDGSVRSHGISASDDPGLLHRIASRFRLLRILFVPLCQPFWGPPHRRVQRTGPSLCNTEAKTPVTAACRIDFLSRSITESRNTTELRNIFDSGL